MHPLHRPEVSMSPQQFAATAFSQLRANVRTSVRYRRHGRGALASLVFAVALTFGVSVAIPAAQVGAVPVNERTAAWISVTARRVALELRAVRDLPEVETRNVAGRQIDELASLVAFLLESDAAALRQVWLDAPIQRKIAVFSALSQVGVPYRTNADAPFIALDCSALTKFAWAQAGLNIDRGSQQQFDRSARIERDFVQAGDFVWYPGHIMMSLGLPELIVHARSGDRAVEVHRIAASRFSGMRWVSPIG
jgi:hypothetical protein